MALTRVEKLYARRIDPMVKVAGSKEAYARLTKEDSAVQYAIGAMQPIDPGYTQVTIEERQRVQDQLALAFSTVGVGVEFDYQGSVTNDTHIRAYSDVDLLVVQKAFHYVEPPNKPMHPYSGDAIAELRESRTSAADALRSSYPAAKVDSTSPKAINVAGGSLRRKVDVIPCAWWHTVEYVAYQQKYFLGIQILDNDRGEPIANKPFLHNKKIDDRDTETNGGLRKGIRLLKSLKYDSDSAIELSSYDIAGIVFNMPESMLCSRPGQDLLLVRNCRDYLNALKSDAQLRETIRVPNQMRPVFGPDGASVLGLAQMHAAVALLVSEIEAGLTKSFRKLAEARISY